MQRLGSLKHFARAAGAALFAAALAPTTGVAQPAPAPTEGKVKVEWLGHEFYRFTSPKGIVVVTRMMTTVDATATGVRTRIFQPLSAPCRIGASTKT